MDKPIHFILMIVFFVPLAIAMMLGMYGLSIMENCDKNNDCYIKIDGEEQRIFTDMQYELLWYVMSITPLSLFALIYFGLFTKLDRGMFKIKRKNNG